MEQAAERLTTRRLVLEPLVAEHAAEMVDVLADPALYEFTGGEAPALEELRDRYARLAIGRSGDGTQRWLNWVVRLSDPGVLVGFVQATVEGVGAEPVAEIAWVISPDHQGHGIASEATQSMLGWLKLHGVRRFAAYIHPDHQASMEVARRQGLHPTTVVQEGEIRWESGRLVSIEP